MARKAVFVRSLILSFSVTLGWVSVTMAFMAKPALERGMRVYERIFFVQPPRGMD